MKSLRFVKLGFCQPLHSRVGHGLYLSMYWIILGHALRKRFGSDAFALGDCDPLSAWVSTTSATDYQT